MPNKTIYVSEQDVTLFEKAKEIAGEALSSVISIALREYVAKHEKKAQGMKEISVRIGKSEAEREVRFVGVESGKWQGFDDSKEWWMQATIYRTQKSNWAVHLVTVSKATLLTNRRAWKASGDYLIDARNAVLHIGVTPKDFEKLLPLELHKTLVQLMDKNEKPVEYLDI